MSISGLHQLSNRSRHEEHDSVLAEKFLEYLRVNKGSSQNLAAKQSFGQQLFQAECYMIVQHLLLHSQGTS